MIASELIRLQSACDALIARQKTLLLSSRSPEGVVDISYAPYLLEDSKYYIYVSELARHTQNLLAVPQASILFIEPEDAANNLFARQRLTFNCQVEEIDKNTHCYSHCLDAMADKFGDIVSVLRALPDFHLLALTPRQGLFVAGFGKAVGVNGDGRLQIAEHRTSV